MTTLLKIIAIFCFVFAHSIELYTYIRNNDWKENRKGANE